MIKTSASLLASAHDARWWCFPPGEFASMASEPTRFMKMIDRLARDTKFKTFGDVFKNGLVAECKRKYKNYPRFIRGLQRRWKQYKASQVARLLSDHHEFVFNTLFCTLLHFDPGRLEILEPNTRSDVDFNAKFQYTYTDAEISHIERALEKHDIKFVKPLVVMNQLVLTGLRLLGPLIESFFGRPYDFQPERVDDEDVPGGKRVKIFFSSREA